MNNTRISLVVAILSLFTINASFAADEVDTKTPLSQSTQSVNKNLARDPDNKGLTNASKRLETNDEKIEAHKDALKDKATRVEKIERPQKPERPEKVRVN